MSKLKKPYANMSELTSNFLALYGENSACQLERYNKEFDRFKDVYNECSAYVASSSGRVEVCGNHTDHNGGRVLSCAISLDTLAMFLPTDDGIVRIMSEGYPEIVVDLNGIENEKIGTSPALVRGVAVGCVKRGFKIGGFKATFTSNVLGGAGISSSASFEVLVSEIFNFLYNNSKMTAEDKAIVSQFAENVYFGKPCGLLDQTAIAYGGLKKLDFKNKEKIEVTSIENPLSDYTLVLIDTGGTHENLTDEYASIPSEMFAVANALGKNRLIETNREEFLSKLPEIKNSLSDRAVLRAMHFFDENERVDSACDALNKNDFETFLRSVKDSGISSWSKLQNCCVAGSACQVIPYSLTVAEAYLNGGVNRVHGGGFAGSILNIVKNDNLQNFVSAVSKLFGRDKVIPLKVRTVGTIVL